MQLIVYEDREWPAFAPLTYTRPVMELRCGSRTLLQRVEALAEARPVLPWARDGLVEYAPADEPGGPALFLNGRGLWWALPDEKPGWVGVAGDQIACVAADEELASSFRAALSDGDPAALTDHLPRRDVTDLVTLAASPWDLIDAIPAAVSADALGLPAATPAGHLVAVTAPDAVFIDSSARIGPFTAIDASAGPVIVAAGVTVEPHCTLSGPLVIDRDSIIRAGAALRGSTIGPVCRIGGEISASIVQGFANKQHDGFLGHSYVGAWVNLGAGTTTSNLKHTYGPVRVPRLYTADGDHRADTGRVFAGALIGDHVKTGIGTMLTTGSVIGLGSAIAVPRPPQLVPSATWLTGDGAVPYDIERFVAVARTVMGRRHVELDEESERRLRANVATARRHERDARDSTSRHTDKETLR